MARRWSWERQTPRAPVARRCTSAAEVTWSRKKFLQPSHDAPVPNTLQSEHFGASVAIDGLNSGKRILVGSPDWNGKNNGQGRAFVFEGSGTSWNRVARLTANGGLPGNEEALEGLAGDHFGASVSLSGNYAVVGAPDDDGVAIDQGSAYVFYALADQGSGTGSSWASFERFERTG